MATHHQEQLQASQYTPSAVVKKAAIAAAAVGICAFLIGILKFQDRAWPAFLLAFFYFSCIAIGVPCLSCSSRSKSVNPGP